MRHNFKCLEVPTRLACILVVNADTAKAACFLVFKISFATKRIEYERDLHAKDIAHARQNMNSLECVN